MKINKKLIGHAFENAILIVSSIILYDFVKIIFRILKKKIPNREKFHKFITVLGHLLSVFIIDIIVIIILDEYFDIIVFS